MSDDIKKEIEKLKQARIKVLLTISSTTTTYTPEVIELESKIKDLYKQEFKADNNDCFFCWLDILGYKNLVEKDPADIYARLKKAIEVDIDLYINSIDEEYGVKKYSSGATKIYNDGSRKKYNSMNFKETFNIEIFSDAIMIKAKLGVNSSSSDNILGVFLGIINIIFSSLLYNNIFTRGAIAYGKHIEQNLNSEYTTGKVTVSPSLIKAYTLESEKAKYSRIIIDKSFFNAINFKDKDFIKFSIERNNFLVDTQDGETILSLKLKSVNNVFIEKYKDKFIYYRNNDVKDEEIALKYKYMLDLMDFQKSGYKINNDEAWFKFRRMKENDFK